MVAVAGAILVDDGFPILFRQQRLGRGRQAFTIVKFRTMQAAEGTGDWTQRDDPRANKWPSNAGSDGNRTCSSHEFKSHV